MALHGRIYGWRMNPTSATTGMQQVRDFVQKVSQIWRHKLRHCVRMLKFVFQCVKKDGAASCLMQRGKKLEEDDALSELALRI